MGKKQIKKVKKWPPYTRWYDKLPPESEESKRLKEQCRDLGITNIIWGK
jgi:hypothetical protein